MTDTENDPEMSLVQAYINSATDNDERHRRESVMYRLLNSRGLKPLDGIANEHKEIYHGL